MPVASLANICASPWGEPLLQDISFDLAKREVLGILGPNGAGKSTLLNLLCGATTPTSGSFQLQGRSADNWSIAERARAMAILPQQSALNFPYTVEEVILLGRTPHASGASADRKVLEEVLIATDTAELRHRLYTQLSGGEKQRVQLARVFAQVWREQDSDYRLLLLDEPTAALDLSHQQLIMESVKSLSVKGCAVVMIVHDFDLAARSCDQCLVLKQGQQWGLGKPGEIFTAELFKEVFEVDVSIIDHPSLGGPLVVRT